MESVAALRQVEARVAPGLHKALSPPILTSTGDGPDESRAISGVMFTARAPACRKARAIRILRFSARHPPSCPGRLNASRQGERVSASDHTNSLRRPGESRYPEPLAPCLLPLDPGFRRDDGASFAAGSI